MAYAAVISLKHTIERLINPINPQITKSAYEELKLLEDILKRLDGSSTSSINRSAIYKLDAQIREAACKLEDAVESYAWYFSLPPSDSLGDGKFPQIPTVDEKGLKEEIDSFLKKSKNLEEDYTRELDSPLPEEEDDDVSPIHDLGGNKSTTIGLSDQFEEIINGLMDLQSRLKIVSLFGMAGIGKTHHTRRIYHHPAITQEFDLRVWASIGPKLKIKNVLMDIAAQIDNMSRNSYMEKDKNSLGEHVKEKLSGRRYFIVLDDIWSTVAWDALKKWFPIEAHGSRILLTTRLEEAAKYPTTSSNTHQIRWLNNEESWNLLWRNVFTDERSFPRELEKAGRKIAEDCEGLPLLILAVAKILRGQEKTEEYWKKVAEKKTTTFPDAYDSIADVLLLSFEYLPQYLKGCFLYMGVFPQSFEFSIPKLINLWSVEDFLEPKQFQTFEDFAMECVKKLVSQSLLIVCKLSSNYGIKSCKLHSAYWHLCVKEARKNKFLHVLNNSKDCSRYYFESQRRLSVQNNVLFGIKYVNDLMAATLTARSLLCTGGDHQYPVPIRFNLIFLKVLDALTIRFFQFPDEVVKLLQLRYLALTLNGKLPSFISELQSLQSLIVRQYHNIKFLRDSTRFPNVQEEKSMELLRDSTGLPKEIWDMQELRHLRIMGSNLPDPSNGASLPNLLTFHVDAHSCNEDVFRSIPKLKKLAIKIELQPDAAETLSCFERISILHELESLKCVVANPRLRSRVVAPPDHLSNLPQGLKKLSLNGLGYSWEYMRVIGSLPNLQVLKLRCFAFQGLEWETRADEFPQLEFLSLEDIDLVDWMADDDDCFPYLRRLIIQNCYKLKGIPSQIGAIRALKTIEVIDCSPSVVDSAQQIQKEEEVYGNFYLQVLISSTWSL